MRKNSWLACALALVACAEEASAKQASDLQGVVELDTVTLAFEIGGRVESVSVTEGDHVEGKVALASLDESLIRPERDARAAELEAQKAQLALIEAGARSEEVRATEAEVRTAEGQLAVLERQRARTVQLTSNGAAAPALLDDLEAQAATLHGRRSVLLEKLRTQRTGPRKQEIEVARARVSALEAALVAADVRLSRSRLSYEGSADVLEVHVKVGEVVAPGSPALTVAELDHPYVDVFVPQAEIGPVKVGAPMWVRVDSLQHPLRGKVERISSSTEFTPRFIFSDKERANLVVRVRVRIDDPKHALHAGIPAFVATRTEEK